MQTIKTNLFELEVSDLFQNRRIIFESVRAEYEVGDDLVTIGVSPIENSYYTKQEGKSLKEKFINFCLNRRGAAKLLEEWSVEIGGYEANICTVINEETGYSFYFGMLAIDHACSIDFIGDCETALWEKSFALFEQAFLSIRVIGNAQEAVDSQQEAINELFAPYDSLDKKEKDDSLVYDDPMAFEIPKNGEAYFSVDGLDFDYLDSSETNIPSHSNTGSDLVVTLKARIKNYNDAQHGHILNDYEDGEVYFTFSVNNIYQPDAPNGIISFEKDYDVKREAYLWKGGFKYNLELFGQLVLKDGWIGMNGYFQTITEDARYPISFAKQLQLERISWEHYHFSSLEELFLAPVNLPRHVRLKKVDAATLPDQLFTYTGLESLSITLDKNAQDGMALEEIPKQLIALTSLKELVLVGFWKVKEIPEEISALHHLRLLFITGTQITLIPENLLALPQLEYGTLSNNRLQKLPESFSPSLKSLSLDGNQLQTVPETLCDLPNLRRLDISKNPLTRLPDGLERIESLTLELEKKQSLLDYIYKGADGKGTIAIQAELFTALHDPDLNEKLTRALRDEYWTPYERGIKSLALRSLALETTHLDDYSMKGNTRFGGLPDLPEKIEYPVFTTYDKRLMGYQFIAQLNCAELAPYQDYMPRHGILYFFITDQEDFKAKVIYAAETDSLVSAAQLPIEEDFIYDDHGIFSACSVKIGKYASVPNFYSDEDLYVDEAANLSDLEEEYERVEALKLRLEDNLSVKPVHSINSYVFKQHDSPQIEAANQLRGNAKDFMVLLRVSSDNLPGFCFWDSGEIYFVIHKSDLAKADFSNVYCGLESS
ncbi:DUF1963 domain-containing protein [Olivibacter sp. CPCC 100613]|uniref:DUF1963 domain-containing protein n=1 Tax=Olivibacter sp. CPCC 100613 TaxID=3079931 RepID=UPI002FF8D4EF